MANSNSEPNSLPEPRLTPYGDSALYLKFETTGYNTLVNESVLDLAARLRASGKWADVISGYDSIVAAFNPLNMNLDTATQTLENELISRKKAATNLSSVIEVPIYYGGEFGPDMDMITKSSGLSEAEVIKLHSQKPYRVCMMGFVPGFTFLSEAPKALHHPRLETPRLSVPSGSVGIAGWQTGIYGLSSPGGWQIIGRTPLKIFDANRETPFLWQAGDTLRFIPQTGPYPHEDTPRQPFAEGVMS